MRILSLCLLLTFIVSGSQLLAQSPTSLDTVLQKENAAANVKVKPAGKVDDLTYLRRVTIDLVGRIPTYEEIEEYQSWSPRDRRQKVVDKLLNDIRFTDRWTVFMSDMLRLRANTEGGARLIAFVHQAIEERMPYDELSHRLISSNGKVGTVPEVGFILGDNADPMALAGSVSQTFMGIRISCAQCHDHPFDVWTQEDFYGFASYFGKTKRVETRFQDRVLAIYTTDTNQNVILWPPEGKEEEGEKRTPVDPRFPFELAKADRSTKPIARLAALRTQKTEVKEEKPEETASIDDLLSDADNTIAKTVGKNKEDTLGVLSQLKKDQKSISKLSSKYTQSEVRMQLADLITSPKNRYFAQCFANRIWAEFMGLGIVDPVDDFSAGNNPSHPETLDYLADEFIASGYDMRELIRIIVTSDAYQRSHAGDVSVAEREELEKNYLAAPMRRMISEVLYDSLIVAGHLFDVKHEAGENMTIAWRESRIMKKPTKQAANLNQVASLNDAGTNDAGTSPKMKKEKKMVKPENSYDLEKSIDALDFDALLKEEKDAPAVEAMQVMSAEELEAMRMAQESARMQADYFTRFVKVEFDDNPKYSTAMRMSSPAPPEHFLRIFGQNDRAELGQVRDHVPTMRQSLMMLNGRLTHEAARVGKLEPVYQLLVGKSANLDRAIDRIYMEIMTRHPSQEEIEMAKEVIRGSENQMAGVADFRWVLLNCNEFRFIP